MNNNETLDTVRELHFKKIKVQKGITLIALVITIIVLLILAGISIVTLTGENGILTKAEHATKETEIEEAKEQAKLDITKWVADQIEKGESVNIKDSDIQKILEGKDYVGSIETDKFTTKKNGYEVRYADLYHMMEEDDKEVKPGVTVTEENKTYTKNGTAIIPVGFSIIPGLDDVSEGLVIKDKENNQFVWIPVTNESEYRRNTTYKQTEVSETAIDDTDYLPKGVVIPEGKTEGQVEKEMVVKAGGFYIGRYEAGKEGTSTLVSKKGATVWLYITQTEAKEKAKDFIINNEKVKSGLITGIQWDVTMAFINKKPRLDGEGKTYDVTKYSTTRHNKGSIATSGQNEADKVCNIYDLEGNGWEYIAEKSTNDEDTPYVLRGGDYYMGNDYPASHRFNYDGKGYHNRVYRLVLYV